MTTNFRDLKPDIPDEKKTRAREDLARELERHAGGLADLRKLKGVTQTAIAEDLEISQAQVSRLENGTDALVSSITRYIDALGGEFLLVARLDGRERTFHLGGLGVQTPARRLGPHADALRASRR